VVFVPATAAGDRVKAKIIKVTKNYAVGKLSEILVPSPDRCENGCDVSAKCGGCSFRHITYEAECDLKRAMINDSFSHIGGLDLEISEFLGAKETERYRNKAMYPVAQDKDGKLISGFYAAMSHRVIEHSDCLIGPEIFAKIYKDSTDRNDFDVSRDIIERYFCMDSGKLATQDCYNDIRGSRVKLGYFACGDEPNEYCTLHKSVVIDTNDGLIADVMTPSFRRRRVSLIDYARAEEFEGINILDSDYFIDSRKRK
jgi:23S rRNA (uracil1939-C5)-methyltransferase